MLDNICIHILLKSQTGPSQSSEAIGGNPSSHLPEVVVWILLYGKHLVSRWTLKERLGAPTSHVGDFNEAEDDYGL